MADSQFDLIVLGGGPGGYVAAIRAAQLGMQVALVERDNLGGVCLNWGCIPTKALLKNANVVETFSHANDFGIQVEKFSADFGKAIDRSRVVSNRLVKGVEFLMKKNKIQVFKGEGVLTAANRIELNRAINRTEDGRGLTAKNILIATGARAITIPGLPLDGKDVITSREALELRELPSPIVVVGAGPIGMEFAYIYRAYGAEVTVVEMLPHLLPREDAEVSAVVEKEMGKLGINFRLNTKVESAEKVNGKVQLKVSSAGKTETIEAQKVLVAISVKPNSENLGLEALGVEMTRGAIGVNDQMQTNVPGIYAIGDVTMKLPLAHVASHQGVIVAEAIAGKNPRPLDLNNVPRCTYCTPQVASLGLTEQQAKEAGHDVRVGKFNFRANGKALGINEYEGFVKLVVDKKYGEILGAHLVGPEVTDLTGELSLAKSMELTPAELAHAVHAHPTLTEVIAEAALDSMGESIHQ
ncbi:MAG: dihydrolipoyl dehydrogenase [Chloroflexi bacterium]|nr:dihydrolipoyl dehydrogenase [Chloroflexota bacterium]